MKELTKEEIIENLNDLHEFKYRYTEYYKNTKLRDFFNKTFGATILQAFSTEKKYALSRGLDFSGDRIILVNNKKEIVYITNSEWASISIL